MEAVKTITNAQTLAPAAEKVVQKKEDKQSLTPLFYQPKLTIGSPDDPLEKEADDMADKVMRMEMPSPANLSLSKSVYRKCEHCEEEEKKQVQRKENSNNSAAVAPPIVQDVVNSSGRSLDTDTRSFMESRFNYDFSNVKIHDNDLAAKSASSINALAYTSGNNIVFNSGHYNTSSDSGKRLLAHELTHVVQQDRESDGETKRKIRRRVLRNATLRQLCGSDEPMVRTPPSGFLTLRSGESNIKITANLRWDRPANCPDGGTYWITLFRHRSIIWDDNTDGAISFAVGSSQVYTWSGLPSDGEYYAEIRSANTNPNCCLTGSIDIEAF